MTTEPTEQQRAAFERMCIKRWRGDRNALKRRADGEYEMGNVEFAWVAWQAALAASPVEAPAQPVERDAERYRYLRNGDSDVSEVVREPGRYSELLAGEELDAAIDKHLPPQVAAVEAKPEAPTDQDERAAVDFYTRNPSAALFDLRKRIDGPKPAEAPEQPALPPLPEPAQFEAMLRMINGHQYGLRGFGDGSLSRGRDLTDKERATIMKALMIAAKAADQMRTYGAACVAAAPVRTGVPTGWTIKHINAKWIRVTGPDGQGANLDSRSIQCDGLFYALCSALLSGQGKE